MNGKLQIVKNINNKKQKQKVKKETGNKKQKIKKQKILINV